MLGRRLLHAFAKSKSKTSPHVITSDSNMIVDHLAFTHTDFMSRIMNWIRNSNASSQLNRNMDGKFKKHAFEQEALEKYLKACECYEHRNYRDIFNYVGTTLVTAFKTQAKKPKNVQMDLSWNLLPDATKSQLMMVRMHQHKLSQFRSSDKWYQVTMKFSNDAGKFTYNVLEKHQKNSQFKFVKFDA